MQFIEILEFVKRPAPKLGHNVVIRNNFELLSSDHSCSKPGIDRCITKANPFFYIFYNGILSNIVTVPLLRDQSGKHELTMSSSSTKLLIGSAALLVAAAAAPYFMNSSLSSRALEEIDDSEEQKDFITDEDVCKVFDRLFLEMQAVLAQLSQTVQQIQMSGQHIPEKQLRQILKSEYERALVVKQKQALEEADMDYDCFEEATWEFLDKEKEYPKVKKSVERFQKLWENVSGENVVGKRPGGKSGQIEEEMFELLSAAKTIEAAEAYFDSLTKAMGELVEAAKKEGKDMRDPVVAQQLQMDFAGEANDKGEEALKNMGISLTQFQKSIEANATNPQVGRSLGMMQMKQQQALLSMGVPGG
jgi:hypothetical protein